jgi:hypothetical protein
MNDFTMPLIGFLVAFTIVFVFSVDYVETTNKYETTQEIQELREVRFFTQGYLACLEDQKE